MWSAKYGPRKPLPAGSATTARVVLDAVWWLVATPTVHMFRLGSVYPSSFLFLGVIHRTITCCATEFWSHCRYVVLGSLMPPLAGLYR